MAERAVKVHRDEWGVAHVYAEIEADGFFGLGYAQAEDRLEQIGRAYLVAVGREASVFGPDYVEGDLGTRRWRFVEQARAGLADLSPQLQADFEAYHEGIEAYMAEHPEAVPDWMPELEPALIMAAGQRAQWEGRGNEGILKCHLIGVTPVSEIEGYPAPPGPSESNAMAVSPWRTREGVSMFIGDGHGASTTEHYRWEAVLHAGDLHVAGHFDPGRGLPTIGHTRHLAWQQTTGHLDSSDIYVVEVDPDDDLRYRFDGEWRTMAHEEVTVEVADGEPVTKRFDTTHHNTGFSSIVARVDGKAYALSNPYWETAGICNEEIYRQLLAENAAEFRAALGDSPAPEQINIVGADSSGSIFYLRAGRAPIRPEGFDFTRPVPGDTSATAWLGIHPVEDLVQLQDPADGFLQNNNIGPDRVCINSPLRPEAYSWYLWNELPRQIHTRGMRANELLSAAYDLTDEGLLAIATDEHWIRSRGWCAALRDVVWRRAEETAAWTADERAVLSSITTFDGELHPESVGALAYATWLEALFNQEGASLADNEQLVDLVEGRYDPRLLEVIYQVWDHVPRTPTDEARAGVGPDAAGQQRLVDAVRGAAALMRQRFGRVGVAFGEAFRVTLGDIEVPGRSVEIGFYDAAAYSDQPLRCMYPGADRRDDGVVQVVAGGPALNIVVFSDPVRSWSMQLPGAAGDPASPHYADQLALYSERRLKPRWFEPEQLDGHIVSTYEPGRAS